METKWVMIAMTLSFIAMFGAIAVGKHSKNAAEVEFAKAGLQECSEDGRIIWKKECK